MPTMDETLEEVGPQPGEDPIERLQHVVRVYAGQDPTNTAITATSNVYDRGVWTGLIFGDIANLEEAIRKDEREKTIATLKRSGHIKS